MLAESKVSPKASAASGIRKLRLKSRALEIAGIYALFGFLWIFFSDRVLAILVPDPNQLLAWSSYKGWAFVVITAFLLFLLLKHSFGVVGSSYTLLKSTEQTLRGEKIFTDTMIESMPGILYFYDMQGKFLRWNRNFQTVSGYSAEEIARMHPLDFFTGADKTVVEERIAEVFAKGESSAQADFVAKDGTATPYFFTGRSVHFEGKSCLVGMGIDVSERKRAQDKLAESEARYRKLFDYAPDGIVISAPDTRYTDANPSMCRMLGYTYDEFVGLRAADIVDTSQIASIEPAMNEIIGKVEHHRNWRFRRKDNSILEAEVMATLMPDGNVLAMIRDISERKEAQDKLEKSEQKYRELVESANSIILRWNAEGRVTFINKFGQQFFGYSSEELIGQHVMETIVPPSESSGRNLQRLMEEICAAPESFEQNINENMRRNGERVWISWTNRIVRDPKGRVVEIMSIGADITDRRRVEAEQEKRYRAEAADRIKSAFLATMSHELRTPLNSIIGFTGILLQGMTGPLNAEQNKQLDMVRTSARHLLALVNDVLDISKIEAGQLEVTLAPFDMSRSITKVLSLVTPQAAAKKLELRTELSPRLGEAVGDERRFEQILFNLFSNAIKFTERGYVALRAEVKDEIKLPGSEAGQAVVCLSVSDTGIGIKADDLKTLFQPFRQVDSGLSRNYDGTGLGLAICGRLAGLMGGEIAAQSEFGKGSTFTVTLPLKGFTK